VVFDAAQRARLDAIFPDGVCDYAQGDARRPGPLRADSGPTPGAAGRRHTPARDDIMGA